MDIRDSLELMLSEPDQLFSRRFYQNFFTHHPEIQDLFAGVDLTRQRILLNIALQAMVTHFLRPYPAMKNYLRYLGQKHHQRGIDAADYGKFEISLLTTLGTFHGKDWDDHLAKQWRLACQGATAVMAEGHADSFSVE